MIVFLFSFLQNWWKINVLELFVYRINFQCFVFKDVDMRRPIRKKRRSRWGDQKAPVTEPPGVVAPGLAPIGMMNSSIPPPGIANPTLSSLAPPGIANLSIPPPGVANPGFPPPGVVMPTLGVPTMGAVGGASMPGMFCVFIYFIF